MLQDPYLWESALTRHYLRSDGPEGASALSFLNADPAELATAVGLAASEGERAASAFTRLFSSASFARDVFTHGHRPAPRDEGSPGWFRYLVLTCLAASDAGDEGQFRERLRTLAGWSSPLMDFGSLPRLWEALARWSAARHAEGEPFRRIDLPETGWMVQIGHSVRLAFPARRDRERLTRLVGEAGGSAFSSPGRTVRTIRGCLDRFVWAPSFAAAFVDFEKRYLMGDRLLSIHPFHKLVEEVLWTARREGGGREVAPLDVTLLTGLDQTVEIEFKSAFPIRGLDLEPVPTLDDGSAYVRAGPPATMLDAVREPAVDSSSTRALRKAAILGLVPFVETSWGRWTFLDEVEGGPVRALVGSESCRRLPASGAWEPVDEGWRLTPELGRGEFGDLLRALGCPVAKMDAVRRLRAVGGVRTGSCWLGRAVALPEIESAPGVDLTLRASRPERGEPFLKTSGQSTAPIDVVGPLSGAWTIVAREASGHETELRLTFVERAFEHDRATDAGSLAPDWDMIPEMLREGAGHRPRGMRAGAPTVECPEPERALLDLTEAVYAGGRSGWSEAELLVLIDRATTKSGPSRWDVLRALREGGWIESRTSPRWRAMRWFLRPPRLIRLANDRAVLDGAVCATGLARLSAAAHGSRVRVESRPGCGPWSVPTTVFVGNNLDAFAAGDGLQLVQEPSATFRPAPACWPPSDHSAANRHVAGVWDDDARRFVDAGRSRPGRTFLLERLRRPRADARDVYLVRDRAGGERLFESRVGAVMEMHRVAGRALFRVRGDVLVRRAAEGWLPEPIARRLHHRLLSSPGPVRTDGGWSYAYPVDARSCAELAELFGPAIEHAANVRDHAWEAALSRRLGRRGRGVVAQLAARPSPVSGR